MTEKLKHAIKNAQEAIQKYTPEVLDPKKLESMINTILGKKES